MIHIIYASQARTGLTPEELDSLLMKARIRNAEHHVTGMLLYHSGSFLQVLEGSEAGVGLIFDSISRDPRHEDIRIIRREAILFREFAEWTMGFIDTSKWPRKIAGKVDYIFEVPRLVAESTVSRRYLRLFRQGLHRQQLPATALL
jgi:hypothetical protein